MDDKDMWLKAVDEELDNMKRMKVFTIINKVSKDSNHFNKMDFQLQKKFRR